MKLSPNEHSMQQTYPTPTTMQQVGAPMLSSSAERVLRFIKDYFKTTNSMPTIREIMRYLGFRSTNSVYKQIKNLEEAGVVCKQSNGRLAFPDVVPSFQFAGAVSAGFSSPVKETKVDMVSLDEFLIQHPKQTFLLSVSGDSMKDAGILEGDYILVERGSPHKSGDLVVVTTEQGYVVKQYIDEGGKQVLRSANDEYKDVPLQEGWTVFGPVVAVVRKTMYL